MLVRANPVWGFVVCLCLICSYTENPCILGCKVDKMHMSIYYLTFLHFTDITFCHKLIIACRIITNEKILNCRPILGRRTTDIWMLSALQALSTHHHVPPYTNIYFRICSSDRKTEAPPPLYSAAFFSLLCACLFTPLQSPLSPLPLLFNSLALCLPSVSSSLSLSFSLLFLSLTSVSSPSLSSQCVFLLR